MKKLYTITAALACSSSVIAIAQGDVIGVAGSDSETVLDSAEPPSENLNSLIGPIAAVGITIEPQGALDLGEIFPLAEADGRLFRGRKVFVAPGGVVPLHSHIGRPAITFVAKGEIVEHRSDAGGPIVHKAGDATFDKDGVEQWWENKSEDFAVLLVVDILPPDGEGQDEI